MPPVQVQAQAAARPESDLLMKMARLFVLTYLGIYVLESPTRYVLYLVHVSAGIVLRDLLILTPLLLIGFSGLIKRTLHPAFLVFSAFVAVSSIVSIGNFGSPLSAAVGTKILLTVLFGLVFGSVLLKQDKWTTRLLLAFWCITLTGLVVEKYLVTFPWVGLHDTIGGVDVELSRDWQISDPSSQRVGGFTRESIAAAAVLPSLALMPFFRIRFYVVKAAFLGLTLFGLYLTTQKGALLSFAIVSGVLLMPKGMHLTSLRLLALVGILLEIGLPILTNGLHMPQGHGGVFSAASFAQRVDETWPSSFNWIERRQIFPFGVGMGGIGAAQKIFGNAAEHYPDNMFILLYAFFGLGAFLIYVWIAGAVVRSISLADELVAGPLAILVYLLFYGIVVSLIEDQSCSVFMGSSLGVLLCSQKTKFLGTRVATHRPFTPSPLRMS